ncbi:MAG: hypothetical protein HYY06_25395 [Deltaproteobacteria bacterium]|nr:hypothetical protein [Deltaproteobacteria bacterium]
MCLASAWLCSGCDCGGKSHPPGGDPCAGADGELPPECGDPCAGGECDCEDQPLAVGCPCDAVEPVPCFSGDAEAADVGACKAGLRRCMDGRWTSCAGEILPADETCDDLDNDCDGEVDEGVLSECGDCNDDCTTIEWGHADGQTPFEPDESNSTAVAIRDPGALVLTGDQLALRVIWIANSPEGTVSLIDTDARIERGRYRTGPDATTDDPSRTSVDYLGHAYIGNRASYGPGGDGQPAVVKILEHDCPDLDGDGIVETSSGGGDVLEWGEDECVAWRTEVGENMLAAARGIAAQVKVEGGAPREVVWAGLTYEERYVELDGETGEPTGLEATCPCGIYGAALDSQGNLWTSCMYDGMVCRFDTYDPEDWEVFPNLSPYGITVAPDDRVWIGGGVAFYDPVEATWTRLQNWYGSGITADLNGFVWVGGCGSGTCRIDTETLEVVDLPDATSRGIAVDFDGLIWGVPNWGYLTVTDPETLESERVLADCDTADGNCLNRPYTYSDMTGTQLRNVGSPLGSWETIVEGCSADFDTRWVRLVWEAETETGTALTLQVRAADSLEDLAAARWVDVAVAPPDSSPAPLADALGDDDDAAYLGIRAILSTGVHGSTPVVHAIGAQRSCGLTFR